MYHPDHFLKQALRSFDASRLASFQRFLRRYPDHKNWILASDYNWHQTSRPQDVLAFTLYPDPIALGSGHKLHRLFKTDFKKCKSVPDDVVSWYTSGAAFHFCFILDGNASFFHTAGANRWEIAKDSLQKTVSYLIDKNAPTHIIDKHRIVAKQSLSKSFNVEIWGDLLLCATCYAFIIGLLTRENRMEHLLWMSDRDKLTTWNDGILCDIALVQAVKYAQKFGYHFDAQNMPFFILTQDDGAKWYDPITRPSDYLAGALSAWSLKTNSMRETSEKYHTMLAHAIAENEFIALLGVVLGKAFMQVAPVTGQRIELSAETT